MSKMDLQRLEKNKSELYKP